MDILRAFLFGIGKETQKVKYAWHLPKHCQKKVNVNRRNTVQFFLDLGHFLKLEPPLPVYQRLLRIKPVPADSNFFKIVSNTVRHGKDEYSFTRISGESQSNHDLCKVEAKKIALDPYLEFSNIWS